MCLAVLLSGCGASIESEDGVPAPEPRRAPNIVLILADDLGYGDLAIYGSTDIETPNIDGLARSGVRFTDGYVTAAVCSPSRAGLMTGRYPQRHGYEFNPSGRPYRLRSDETTMAELLKAAGYATGAVGKWHLGWDDGAHPMDRGFDEFFGMKSGTIYIEPSLEGVESWTPDSRGIPTTRRRAIFRGREEVEEAEYLTDALTREALDFIDRHHEAPFFLYLAHYTPHAPLQATAKYLDRYRHIEDEKTRIFASMVSALDDSVGAVLERLREHDIEEDTLVVFLSDNGCALYVDGACSNGALRGGKRWFFEGGMRVPFLMSWQGQIPAGMEYDSMVSSLDLLPTLVAATGALLPAKAIDGVDLIPYVMGTQEGEPHERLFWRAGPNRAIRDGNWKLWEVNRGDPEKLSLIGRRGGLLPNYEAPRDSPLGQVVRLHDLSGDLGEIDSLAESRPEALERLRDALDRWEEALEAPTWWSTRGTVAEVDGDVIELIF